MNADRDVVVVSGSRHVGLAFATPWLIGFLFLTVAPGVASLLLSLGRWDGLSLRDGFEWVGLDHYRELLFTDDDAPVHGQLFRQALGNSLYITLIGVPLGLVTSLAMALLLNSRIRGIGFFRTVFFLPYLLSGVATVMIWSWLLNPRFGLLNRALHALYGLLDPVIGLFRDGGTSDWVVPDWFYSPAACKPALILMQLWLGGGAMLIFLAALQRVPRALEEAAAIDGAGIRHRFLHVTLPHISPAVFFNLVVGLIFSMQAFDQAYLLYNRAQRDGLLLGMLHLFRTAFDPPYRLGNASAMAWILLGVTGFLIVPVMLLARRWIYEAVRR